MGELDGPSVAQTEPEMFMNILQPDRSILQLLIDKTRRPHNSSGAVRIQFSVE